MPQFLLRETRTGPSLSARAVVAKVCHTLDALHTAGHYESLVLVTSAKDGDKSFIGGTKVGKLFWDALKIGGSNGVKMFKNHCKVQAASGEADAAAVIAGKKCKNSLKSELNTAMRVALRCVHAHDFRAGRLDVVACEHAVCAEWQRCMTNVISL